MNQSISTAHVSGQVAYRGYDLGDRNAEQRSEGRQIIHSLIFSEKSQQLGGISIQERNMNCQLKLGGL